MKKEREFNYVLGILALVGEPRLVRRQAFSALLQETKGVPNEARLITTSTNKTRVSLRSAKPRQNIFILCIVPRIDSLVFFHFTWKRK